MFIATIRTVGGQIVKLDNLSLAQTKALEAAVGKEARYVHNNGATKVVLNLANVETVTIAGKPLKAY